MNTWQHPRWHNILLVALLIAIVADFIFGLDIVLNVISVIVAIVIALALLSMILFGVAVLTWVTIGDAIEETRFDRRCDIAWRWRFVAYAGIIGILIDGAVGAWNAYQQHVLFSVGVEEIPFAGVPVLVTLASYPLKWLEQRVMRNSRSI